MVSRPATPRPPAPLLVFDGDCAACTRLAALAERRVTRGSGSVVAAQWLDLGHYGLTTEQCEQALQFVDADGRTHAAQDAVAWLLLSSGPCWRPLGALMLLPGLRQLAGWGYRWVARNRSRLPGGTPACRHEAGKYGAGPAADGPGADRRKAHRIAACRAMVRSGTPRRWRPGRPG